MSQGQPQDLIRSLQAVKRAKSDVGLARHQPGSRSEESMVPQRELLWALETCASSLASHGHPVPYRMRSDIRMYRALLLPRRHAGA